MFRCFHCHFVCKYLFQNKNCRFEKPENQKLSTSNCLYQTEYKIICLFLQVLKTIRMEVLKGCKIIFSHVFPIKFQAENHPFWRMAEQLGATCSTELDPSVTHVVSTDIGTEKSRWAVKEKKFLVRPGWIEAANYLWQKQPEEKNKENLRDE